MVRWGVRTKANLQPQIVLMPSLLSLYDFVVASAVRVRKKVSIWRERKKRTIMA